MELTKIKEDYEVKLQQISGEIDTFIEYAVNYEELLEDTENKSEIDYSELIFNDAKDMRYFDNLQYTSWMLKQIIDVIGGLIDAQEDKEEVRRVRKELEMLITSFRGIKKESKEVIEHEQQVIGEVDLAIDLLNKFRNK